MRTIYLILFLALLLAYGGFALANFSSLVDLDLIIQHLEVRLVTVVTVALLTGLFTTAILALSHEVRMRTQLRRLRQENRKLSDELASIRTLPLEDLEEAEEEIGL